MYAIWDNTLLLDQDLNNKIGQIDGKDLTNKLLKTGEGSYYLLGLMILSIGLIGCYFSIKKEKEK